MYTIDMKEQVLTRTAPIAALIVSLLQINLSAHSLPLAVGDLSQLPSNAVDMGQATAKIMGLVGNQDVSVDTIHRKAEHTYEEGMPGAGIFIRPHLHPAAIEPDLGEASASVNDLISAARARIETNADRVPPSSVGAILSKIDEMNSKGKIGYEKLPSNELGLYHRICGDKTGKKSAMIGLHPHLSVIATEVGRPLAACVLFHEAGHASDPNICQGSVEDVESFAFKREYDCIRAVYPTGEQIATTYKMLDNAAQGNPSPVIKESVNFMSNIYQIYRTGGNDQKIRELVRKLYNADGTPSSSGA